MIGKSNIGVPHNRRNNIKYKTAPSKYGHLVDTDLVLQENQRVRSISSEENFRKSMELEAKNQKAREESFFNTTTVCMAPTNQSSVRDRLGSLKTNKVESLLNTQFYNAEAMQAMGCLSEAIVSIPMSQKSSIVPNERTRRWITGLKQIGAESVEGFAIKADLNKEPNGLYIIKAPRDPENNELLHEWFVGVKGTNMLRSKVPNFAYIYGGFKCAPPVITPDKDIVAWCNNTKNNVSYVLYENIAPAKSVKQYVQEGCTFQQWLNIYLQTLYALSEANKDIGFTHYDLHDDNVLVREVKGRKNFWIPYTEIYKTGDGRVMKKNVYLNSTGISTIIDFGFSHIIVDGKHYGIYDRMPWGVYPDRTFPLHDAYKLLLMSMRTMLSSKNMDCFNGASKILLFFDSAETAVNIVAKQAHSYYFLPLTHATADGTIDQLISFIRNTIQIDFLKEDRPSENILGCSGNDVCITNQQTMTTMGLLGTSLAAKTIFDFYDLATRLQNRFKNQAPSEQINTRKEWEQLIRGFDYSTIINKAIIEYNQIITETSKALNDTINILTIDDLSLDSIMTKQVLLQYKWFVSKVANLFDHMQRLKVNKDAIIYTSKLYGDELKAQQVETIWNIAYKQKPTLDLLIDSIRKTKNFVQGLIRSELDKVNKLMTKNRDQIWWIIGLDGVLLTMQL